MVEEPAPPGTTPAFPCQPYARLLDRSAERFPEKAAVVFRDGVLSYRALAERVARFANALLGLAVAKGDRVALYMTNRPEYVVAWFACARIGAVATLANPSLREDELLHQLVDSGARVLICGDGQLETARAAARRAAVERLIVAGEGATDGALRFRDLVDRSPSTPPREPPIDPDEDLLALPYSSGTTGTPKGVMLTHRNLTANNLQFVSALSVRPASVTIIYLPFYHIYGCMLLGGTIAAGATQVILERFDPATCLEAIERHRVTHWFAVPPILLRLSEAPELDGFNLSSVEVVMTGAAPLPLEVGRRFAERTGLFVVQGYGLTEAAPLTHANPVGRPELCRLDAVGLPVAGEEQEIVDLETGERVLGAGETGELRVRGPHIMKGYWRSPECTAQALRQGWLYTGDVGRIDPDGLLVITDRKKEMIKYNGFGVAPAELEAVLHAHPGVADVAVVGRRDPAAGEVPKAFVVLRPGATASPEELMAFVAVRVAGYKRVREVELIDAIPRNPSGKILRRLLRERDPSPG